MPSFFQFLPLLVSQQLGRQKLSRVPEPAALTDAESNVHQYDQVMTTKLVLAYAVALEIIHRARPENSNSAIDLACGPGHFTLCLARFLGYRTVTGIDLSPPMVETASGNAEKAGLRERVTFQKDDITRLDGVANNSRDFSSFNDAAHHMPDVDTVRKVLINMERVTRPDGLIMVMDLARLRTAKLTERYVRTLGHDYVERGLPMFYQDFHNSMFAAWTVKELRQAIPNSGERWWCQIVPRGLPTIQIVLGLPVGRRRIFLRAGFPWTAEQNPVPAEMRWEWKMMRRTLFMGSRWKQPPASGSNR